MIILAQMRTSALIADGALPAGGLFTLGAGAALPSFGSVRPRLRAARGVALVIPVRWRMKRIEAEKVARALRRGARLGSGKLTDCCEM